MRQEGWGLEGQAQAAAAGGGSVPPAAADQQQLEEPLLGQQRFGTTGFQHAGWPAKATYTFVAPLLRRGAQNKVRCGVVRWWVLPAPPAAAASALRHAAPPHPPISAHGLLLLGLLQIDEDTAAGYLPQQDTAKVLAAEFDDTYATVKVWCNCCRCCR